MADSAQSASSRKPSPRVDRLNEYERERSGASMRREVARWAVVAVIFVAGGLASLAQSPAMPTPQPAEPASSPGGSELAAQSPPASVPSGGKLHGMVKSGNIPLPGVTVTAQNTLTGKRFSTTTDIT